TTFISVPLVDEHPVSQRPRFTNGEGERAVEVRKVRADRPVAADEPRVRMIPVRWMVQHSDSVARRFLADRSRERTAAVRPLRTLPETIRRAGEPRRERHRSAI